MKWAGIALLAAALFAGFGVRAGTGRAAALPDDTIWRVDDFTCTDQNGQPFGRSDLRGKVWVASFIFTRCAGPCAHVTANMARLQKELAGKPGLVFVSFSVDPDYDTPKVLQKYAGHFGADTTSWHFLTGKRGDIYSLIRDSFHLAVTQEDDKNAQSIDHSTRLALVDGVGRIRGFYDGGDGDDLPELKGKIADLLRQENLDWREQLPAVNATLNGACALVLLMGYAAIRRRRIALHRNCMLLALALSAVFLTSYLYFHLAVKHGQPTHFSGEGLARGLYLGILVTHSVLAAVVAPLALFTAYQGLRGRLARHARVARWTLPLWFYVSVTGVIVYLMLYQLYAPVGGQVQ